MLIAIIPARGNSKGVIKKNIRKIGKSTLVDWALDFAVRQKIIDQIILSTDDINIVSSSKFLKTYAGKFKSLAPGEISSATNRIRVHKRRKNHATSNAKTIETILDIIRESKFNSNDKILLLQPTSPFRASADLRKILQLFMMRNTESVVSAKLFDSPHPSKAIKIKKGKLDLEKKLIGNLSAPRQALPDYYVFDGAFYLSNVKNLQKHESFLTPETRILVREGFVTINIDNELDLLFANFAHENM